MADSERVLQGPLLPVVAGVVWMGEQLLVQRRGPGYGADMLEFAGGKIEAGEQPRGALARELCEEWGQAAERLVIGRILEVTRHVYPEPGPDVLLLFFEVDAPADDEWWRGLCPAEGASLVRLRPEALREGDFLAADRAVAAALREGAWRR